jgi:hypothetical protein
VKKTLPAHLRGPMRITAKAGFLTKRIWNDFFATGNRSWRFRRWQSLMDSGYFTRVPDYGFVENAVTLSDRGHIAADSLGLNPVFSPGAKNLWHDEELIRFALFLERHGWVSNWMTEQELKLNDEGSQFFKNEIRAKKLPDLIIEWNTSPKPILWAVELERTRKRYSRYYQMVGGYKGISRIESVLIIAATNTIEANIKKAQAKMNYPQADRPMFFASMNQMISDPLSCELREGANRSSLGNFVQAFTGKSATPASLNEKSPRNKVGSNVSSENRTA